MERLAVAGHDVYLVLAKNASGFTEVLRAVLADGQPKQMMLGLNDCAGKQPDTSWIWDADFSSLPGLAPAAVVSGNRAGDLAVRLKYAGWPPAGAGGVVGGRGGGRGAPRRCESPLGAGAGAIEGWAVPRIEQQAQPAAVAGVQQQVAARPQDTGHLVGRNLR